jgi:hypothetical protein
MHFTKACFGMLIARPQAVAILKEMGADVDGSVYILAFSTWWKSDKPWSEKLRQAIVGEENRVRAIFERVDTDQSGYIDVDELGSIAADLEISKTGRQIDEIFAEIEEEESSHPGEVGFERFDDWLHSGTDHAENFLKNLPVLMSREASPKFPYVPGVSDVCKNIVTHRNFEWVVIAMVLINVIFMTSDYHNMSEWFGAVLHIAEIAFAFIYVTEACMKIFGTGAADYFSKGLNILDFICASASVLGIFMSGLSGLAAFRIVRLLIKLLKVLWMVKIFTRYDTIILLMKTITGSSALLDTLSAFIFFMLLLLGIMASHVLGPCHDPELWGVNELSYNATGFPRVNFWTFGDSVLALFQIATGEDWAPLMYTYMHCYGASAAAFFIAAFFILNFFFVNMFIAVIMENFELSEEEIIVKQEMMWIRKQAELERIGDGDGCGTEQNVEPPDIALGLLEPDNGLRKSFQVLTVLTVQTHGAKTKFHF